MRKLITCFLSGVFSWFYVAHSRISYNNFCHF